MACRINFISLSIDHGLIIASLPVLRGEERLTAVVHDDGRLLWLEPAGKAARLLHHGEQLALRLGFQELCLQVNRLNLHIELVQPA